MTRPLTMGDIDSEIRVKAFDQSYAQKQVIEGMKIVPLKTSVTEDGDFCEILRGKDNKWEDFEGFELSQINRSQLEPNAIKAWHLHLRQDEIWCLIPPSRLSAAFWDVRQNSKTKGQVIKLIMGGGDSQLIYIPRGVAHGIANYSRSPIQLLYFVSEKFDPQNPDEKRIPWDILGKEFWLPKKE